eukprot:g13760.t1
MTKTIKYYFGKNLKSSFVKILELLKCNFEVKQQLLREQAEVQRLCGALKQSEAEALRLSQDVQYSAAANEKDGMFEKQLAMNESRIKELCASLIKAESHISNLEAGLRK